MENNSKNVESFRLCDGSVVRLGDFVRYRNRSGIWKTGQVIEILKDQRSEEEVARDREREGSVFLHNYMQVMLPSTKTDTFHIQSEVTLAKSHQIW